MRLKRHYIKNMGLGLRRVEWDEGSIFISRYGGIEE